MFINFISSWLTGNLLLVEVAGNFHIAPGHSFSQNHIHGNDV